MEPRPNDTPPPVGDSNAVWLSMSAYELPDKPGVVTREVREYSLPSYTEEQSREALEQAFRATAPLFSELEPKFGIKHAGYDFSMGPSIKDGRLVGQVESRKIEGFVYPLPDGPEFVDERRARMTIEPAHMAAAKSLVGKLSHYFTEKIRNDEPLLDDIFGLDQYIYTEPTPDNPDGEFVLVDTTPPGVEDGQVDYSPVFAQQGLETLAKQSLTPEEFTSWQTTLHQQLATPPAAA